MTIFDFEPRGFMAGNLDPATGDLVNVRYVTPLVSAWHVPSNILANRVRETLRADRTGSGRRRSGKGKRGNR